MESKVRAVRRSDLRRLRRFLGNAFDEDPVMRHCFPDDAARRRDVAWLQQRGVAHGFLHGTAETTDDLDGVVVWFGPGAQSMSFVGSLRSGLVWVPCRLGLPALVRLTRYFRLKKRLRTSCIDRDHWYLFLVAVAPERQGKGTGRRLLEHGLRRVDRDPTPCYLETSREENIGYFERFGFKVRGECRVEAPGGSGPNVWGMVRDADAD